MKREFHKDFGPLGDHIWLNSAHQGALPRVAAEEAREAIGWKIAPYNLTTERFSGVPLRLKHALSRLIGAPPEEIILGNSASYGLHLLANGIKWRAGHEILLLQGDFPSDILPWLALRKKGVAVRFIKPKTFVIQPDELLANITPSTTLLCTTWVHSFSGFAIDARALGEICRARGITFVMNVSQALGTRPLDISTLPVDAVTGVGFKWLCGPYGTGFCWMRHELLESLDYNQAYWLVWQTADDLAKDETVLDLKPNLRARAYDVFGTANFFNFKPWAASIEYLLEQGIERIAAHNQDLVSRFIAGLDRNKYDLISPCEGPARSTLIFISHKRPDRNSDIHQALIKEGIFCASRARKLRFAPHLYNTHAEIDRTLAVLNAIRD